MLTLFGDYFVVRMLVCHGNTPLYPLLSPLISSTGTLLNSIPTVILSLTLKTDGNMHQHRPAIPQDVQLQC